MRQFILLLSVLLIIPMLSSTVEAQSKRNYVLEQHDISAFTELDIDGGFTVHLMQGEKSKADYLTHWFSGFGKN